MFSIKIRATNIKRTYAKFSKKYTSDIKVMEPMYPAISMGSKDLFLHAL